MVSNGLHRRPDLTMISPRLAQVSTRAFLLPLARSLGCNLGVRSAEAPKEFADAALASAASLGDGPAEISESIADAPLVRIPLSAAIALGLVCEVAWRWLGVPPLLTRAEVYKSSAQVWLGEYLANISANILVMDALQERDIALNVPMMQLPPRSTHSPPSGRRPISATPLGSARRRKCAALRRESPNCAENRNRRSARGAWQWRWALRRWCSRRS